MWCIFPFVYVIMKMKMVPAQCAKDTHDTSQAAERQGDAHEFRKEYSISAEAKKNHTGAIGARNVGFPSNGIEMGKR